MKVIHDLYWCPDFEHGSIVTIGEFDGLHRGQRVILLEMFRAAAVAGCPTVVVTFDTNLSRVGTGSTATNRFLTDAGQKLELLDTAGVDFTVVIPADVVASGALTRSSGEAQHGVAGSDPVDWIVDVVLVDALHARSLVIGDTLDSALWRQTSLEELKDRAGSAGLDVVEIPLASRSTSEGDVISAKAIRQTLVEGDVERAADMLGRPYEIRSTVAVGERRGREIGFPTANLPAAPDIQLPGDGVYACWYYREDGTRFKAAVNVGTRPTFHPDNDQSLVEAHLIDFRGDLYGERALLAFIERIRAERRFDNVTELAKQLQIDITTANARLDWHQGCDCQTDPRSDWSGLKR